jgi:hypothetical protein
MANKKGHTDMKSLTQRISPARVACAALAVAVLASALAPGLTEPIAARKSAKPRLVQQLANSTRLNMGDDASAEVSTIEVSGFITEVIDIDLTLHNVNFGAASSQDMDILLMAPAGQTAIVLSDVGGDLPTNNATIVLDDQAAGQLPSNSALISGTFQPTNVGSPDTIKLPNGDNLTPSSNSALSVFNDSDPNGSWRVFAFDDTGNGNTGSITGGWSLRITSKNSPPSAQPDSFQARAGQTLTVNAAGVLGNDSDHDNDPLSAIVVDKPKKGQLNLLPNGGFTYRPGKKAKGTDSFTYLAQDPGGLNAQAEVTIQIKGKNKKRKGKR